MSEDRTFVASTTIFWKSGQRVRIIVPDGQRLLLLSRDETPMLIPIEEAGEYEFSVDELDHDPVFPLAIVNIDLKHVPAWKALNASQVGRILDRCQRAVEDREAGVPISGR